MLHGRRSKGNKVVRRYGRQEEKKMKKGKREQKYNKKRKIYAI